jgi:Flp pilus assembly protein TadG
MKTSRRKQRGNALLEFTFVAIPLIFALISIVELARGMWVYATLAHAVKEGTRYAIVHGEGCAQASPNCPVTVAAVAQVVQGSAVGLDPSQLSAVLTAGGATTCAPISSCASQTSTWPPQPNNNIGLPVTISVSYPFRTAMSMFWPGSSPVRFAPITLGATSEEDIIF